MKSEPRAARRLAVLGMVPIIVLLVSLNVAPLLTTQLGLPMGLAVLIALLLAVVGFFASRAVLRRELTRSGP